MGKYRNININSIKKGEETPVAIYVRMSTDHQKYSIANQTEAIFNYAKKSEMKVIKTYSDKGKSGLTIQGRTGLLSLLSDVETGEAEFKAVLVYDVSRWGRFQDTDESAFYEYTCKKAGIKVHYCEEQFENDGSSISTILKNLKRAMAGEYSRELSAKTFARHSNSVLKGYNVGGGAAYGMRRLLVDQNGNPKQMLKTGEVKAIAHDRIILVPGPKIEQDNVRLMFDLFVNYRMTTGEIAQVLNEKSNQSGCPRIWRHSAVQWVLQNEKYIGNNVYNKTSKKMGGPTVANPPEKWIRANNILEPIVSRKIFRQAQRLTKKRKRSMSDEDMLKGLEKVYKQVGYLSHSVIDAARKIPSAHTYIARFKSIYNAYALVGFHHNDQSRSDEEMLVKLKALYEKHGYLTGGLINKSKGMARSDTYTNRFGSIFNAYELVGYTKEKYDNTPEVMLEKLATLYGRKGYLTGDIINTSELTASAKVYRRVFGSLTEVYRLVGFDPETLKVTDAELIENLKQIYEKHGYLSGLLIDAAGSPYNRAIYSSKFGSLPEAYAKVGFEFETYRTSNKVMILKLKELFEEKGYLSQKVIDTCEDMPNSRTYQKRFGGLDNAYALVGFERKIVDVSKDILLQEAKKLYEEKGWLSQRIIDECKRIPAAITYRRYFGSLKNLYKLVGFRPKYIPD